MRISAAKAMSVIGVTAVAVLGAQYASAAPSPVSHSLSATGASAVTDGGRLAQPNVNPVNNLAYLFTTSAQGGTGDVVYTIPNPPTGFYAASFTANFFPEGSPSAPETFGCSLIKNGTIMRAQSTVSTTYDSGFYAGVNGGNTIHVVPSDTWQVFCGVDDGTSWSYGTRNLQVTLTRLDGQVNGVLSGGSPKQGSSVATTGR